MNGAEPGLRQEAVPARSGTPPVGLWQRKGMVIAALALVAISLHLVLRFGLDATPGAYRIPLLGTLVLGGLPLLYDLLRKLLRRDFGSDLLGGVSIVTSILLAEYLAGTIIVLMLSGGEALERFALRSASSVLAALARRMPSIAHRKGEVEIVDVGLQEVAVGDTLVVYHANARLNRAAYREFVRRFRDRYESAGLTSARGYPGPAPATTGRAG